MDLLNANRELVQADMLRAVYRSHKAGAQYILLQGATGIGKTRVASHIAKGTLSRGGHVLVVTPRRRLTKQMHSTMAALGLNPSYLMAGGAHDWQSPLQVACDKTLKERIRRASRTEADLASQGESTLFHMPRISLRSLLPKANTIIVDETHIGHIGWLKELYPDAVIVGMSATPIKGDGSGLSDQYDDMVLGPSIRDLIGLGLLLPADIVNAEGVFLPDVCDSKEIHLLGKVVDNWLRHARGKRTICFAKSVLHSQYLCDQFLAAGIPAEHVDSTIPDEPGEGGVSPREEIYDRLARGETMALCNYGIVVEGVDIPEVECVILARPDKKLVMGLRTYLQVIGRGRRPYTDPIHGPKTSILVLDHTRTAEKLGHPDQDWEWKLRTTRDETLEAMRNREAQSRKKKEDAETPDTEKLIRCECGASYSPAPKCPECGRDTPPRTHIVEEVPIVLGRKGKATLAWNREAAERLYSELMGYFQQKKAENWMSRAFKCANGKIPEEFRLGWTDLRGLAPTPPSPETAKIAINSQRQFFLLKNKGYIKGKNSPDKSSHP